MYCENCTYNKQFDIEEVDQIGYVDLRKAFETNQIAGNLDVETLDFNGIEDPKAISGKPSNIFDAVTKSHELAAGMENQSSEK